VEIAELMEVIHAIQEQVAAEDTMAAEAPEMVNVLQVAEAEAPHGHHHP
jgi:hypothetical protein